MSGLLKACNGGGDAPIDLTENLVAHYLLNNNADDSHGTNDGTPSGGVDFQGDVAEFDGSYEYIRTPSNFWGITEAFTISLWITPKSWDSVNVVYTNGLSSGNEANIDNGSCTIRLGISGEIVFYLTRNSTDKTTYVLGSTSTADGDAHHVTVSWDGTTGVDNMKLHIDGILDNTSSQTVIPVLDTVNKISNIGGDYYRTTASHDGTISNFRVYNDAKDQAFITALFEEGYYPKPLPLPTTDGLIAHYPLTGTAEDATGNYDGTEVGNTYVDDAEFGSVANFDGVNDYIELSQLPSMTEITASLWFNASLIAGTEGIITLFNINRLNFVVGTTYTNNLHAGVGDATALNPLSALSSTTTYHIAIVGSLSGGWVKLYIDGVIQGTSTDLTTMELFNRKDMIGSYVGSDLLPSSEFNGWISDTRIYNKALTQQEITDIYNYEKNFRPIDIDDGLVAYYPLANNSLDNYYNEYDGTDSAGVTYDGVKASYSSLNRTSLGVNTLPHLTQYTFSFWALRLSAVTATNLIFTLYRRWSSSSSYRSGIAIEILDSGTLRFFIHNSTDNYSISTSISVDTLHHVAITYDNGTVEMFIDNQKVYSAYVAVVAWKSAGPSDDSIGGSYTAQVGQTDSYTGDISKFRVYNKVITAEQVEAIYNTEKGDFI